MNLTKNSDHNDNNRNVAILGNYNNVNLGGKLTVLTTYSTVTELGFNALMMRLKEHDDDPKLLYNKLCKFTESCVDDPEPPSEWNDQFDSFLLCSDWTFAKNWLIKPEIRFFDWVKDGKDIVSFASSFGGLTGGYLEEDHPLLAKRLNRFTSLSVRERSGVEICKKVGALHAVHIPDPVFSQKKEHYLKLAGFEAHIAVGCKYAAVYVVGFSPETVDLAVKTAEKINLKPFFIVAHEDRGSVHLLQNYDHALVGSDGVSAWLYYLSNAEYVITNSFHGTCLSLIFEKNISVIDRAGTYSIRMRDILSQFGADNKLIETEDDIATSVESSLNMSLVNMRLDEMYEKTRRFVVEALSKNDNT